MQDRNADTQEIRPMRNLAGRNVRRRLCFDEGETDGPEDRRGLDDNLANEFFEEVRGNLEKAKERWNFDFENETPLPGNFEWAKLDKDGNQVRETAQDASNEAAENPDDTEGKKNDGSSAARTERPQRLNQSDFNS